MADAATLSILLRLSGQGEFRQAIEGAQSSLKNFEEKIKPLTNVMLAAGAAITGFGMLSFHTFARTGEEIEKMAIKTGFSVESLSELKYAAEQADISLDTVKVAFRGVSNLLTEASGGGKEAAKTLHDLGLSYSELKGQKPEDIFFKIAYAVAEQRDSMLRSGLAIKAFGRSGMELLPLLAQGKEGLERYRQEAHLTGNAMSESLVKRAVLAEDSMKKLKGSIQGLQLAIGAEMAPIMNNFIKKLTDIVIITSAWVASHSGLFRAILAVGSALISFVAILKTVAMSLAIVQALSGPLGWLSLAAAASIAGGTYLGMNELLKTPSIQTQSGRMGVHSASNYYNINVQGSISTEQQFGNNMRREINLTEQRNSAGGLFR